MRLPVHCCCEPGLRVGWIEVSDDRVKVRRIVFARSRQPIRWGQPAAASTQLIHTQVREIVYPLLKIEFLSDGRETVPLLMRRIALDSGDQPVDAWREVAGFIEDQKVYR